MAKSRAALRILRSNIAQRQLRDASRGITSTVPKASIAVSTFKFPQSTPFPPSGFNPKLNTEYFPRKPPETPFAQLLSFITQSLRTNPSANIPYLHSLLRAYTSSPAHWSAYAYADFSRDYTRNLVCEIPGIFNSMLLVWTPGKASPVHDHADSHCLMKVLKGQIRETRFAIPQAKQGDEPLVETSRRDFGTGKVSYMADELGLHSVSNPHPTEYAVSLHLYTPPNAALRGCHVYDMANGGARHVLQGPYDSVRGVASVINSSLDTVKGL